MLSVGIETDGSMSRLTIRLSDAGLKEKGKPAQITSNYDPAAVQRLKSLSETMRVPQSVYLREALDGSLRKYASALKKIK